MLIHSLMIGTRLLDPRLEYNIQIWGHKEHCYSAPYFLPRLLAPLLGRPRFRFGSCFGTVGLAIGGAESRDGEVAVTFSGYSL